MTGSDLELTIGGELLSFPAIWLRDNCWCPDCVAPGTSQKLNDITDMPNGVAITRAAGQGGDTGLVDGFAAAGALRAADPASSGILTGTAASFGYVDKATGLRACQPLIELSPRGRVRGVRFNHRSMRPLRGRNETTG